MLGAQVTAGRMLAACSAWMIFLVFLPPATGQDWPMLNRTPSRNAGELKCPTSISTWDLKDGKSVAWEAHIGRQWFGSPVVAGGLVFVGSNNEDSTAQQYPEDRCILTILRESDGKVLWRRITDKLPSGRSNDWPGWGLTSTPLVEGDLVWYCTNRAEVVCLDVAPLRTGTGEPRELWTLDMVKQLDVWPKKRTSCSPIVFGDNLYVITPNGYDPVRRRVPSPKAPAIVCLHKLTGKVVWSDVSPGDAILDGQHSSPAVATIDGQTQIIAGLGNGWLYSFDPATGKKLWSFDCNLKNAVYPQTRNELLAAPVVVGGRCYIATGQDIFHSTGPGDLWCIDITRHGDISSEIVEGKNVQPNPNSGVIWHAPGGKKAGSEMLRSISSVTIANGLLFAADCCGYVHCFDAEMGKQHWWHDTGSEIYAAPLIVNGEVVVVTEAGDIIILQATKEKKVLLNHESAERTRFTSPIFANGTLYIAKGEYLRAIRPAR